MVGRAAGRLRLDRAAAAASEEAGERQGPRAKVGQSPLEISLRRALSPSRVVSGRGLSGRRNHGISFCLGCPHIPTAENKGISRVTYA